MLGRGRIAEARPVLDSANQMDRNNVAALCGLGFIANAEKNEEKVKEHFHRALAADGECRYAADALKAYYAFRGLRMEYITFEDGQLPTKWRIRGRGALQPVVSGNQLVWRGTQGATTTLKFELFAELTADDFIRLEADLEVLPDSEATLALRLASSAGGGLAWEFEVGKNSGNMLCYRFLDGTVNRDWAPLAPWPASGKTRLTLHTKDLAAGLLALCINGDEKWNGSLKLTRPTRMTAGLYLQCPAKAEVLARAGNILLISRQGEGEVVGPGAGELIPVEKRAVPRSP
jgi:tetratricopeptide (TPR) repeat protein